jgi:hypothetical protein
MEKLTLLDYEDRLNKKASLFTCLHFVGNTKNCFAIKRYCTLIPLLRRGAPQGVGWSAG